MVDRRLFIKQSALVIAGLNVPVIAHATETQMHDKRLNLFNTHTGETFNSVFWTGGQFLPAALEQINYLLRDHRSNTSAPIDKNLLALLAKISAEFGTKNALHVISGYRSPQTNRLLAENTNGVAKHSLHLDGKAIDIRVPGQELSVLRKVAMSLRVGGVGYYPESQFVHVDTGRLRSW